MTLPEGSIPERAPRVRMHYLDGVRGATSFYVMAAHLAAANRPVFNAAVHPLMPLFNIVMNGRPIVSVFIVLSGYCLMLPVARSASGSLEGGFWAYILRRAKRIMPPYYAALFIAMLLTYLDAHRLGETVHFGKLNVISHILLIHNFNRAYIGKIDGPMWSIATEWQIYFLFPLLLLPLFKRSVPAMLGAALFIGLAPMFFFKTGEDAAPWFTLLFGFGMIGAAVNFSPLEKWKSIRQRVNWLAASISASVATLIWHVKWDAIIAKFHVVRGWKMYIVEDVLIGIATTCILVHSTIGLQTAKKSILVKLLESKPLLFLGSISYSLYLMHEPIEAVLSTIVLSISHSPVFSLVLLYAAALPLVLGLTYLFYLVFERPFVLRRG